MLTDISLPAPPNSYSEGYKKNDQCSAFSGEINNTCVLGSKSFAADGLHSAWEAICQKK